MTTGVVLTNATACDRNSVDFYPTPAPATHTHLSEHYVFKVREYGNQRAGKATWQKHSA